MFPTDRTVACRAMIRRAEMADAHFQATGRCHEIWGNGSLMSAARKLPLADEPGFDDADYCACFELVLRALIEQQVAS